jgi:hypothetical protein
MRFRAIALAASLIFATQANGQGVLVNARAQVQSADYRFSGHLVHVDANGNRLSFPINIKAHWFPGDLKVLLEVGAASKTGANSPAAGHFPARLLLEMRPNGQSTIQIVHPGDAAPTALPFDQWKDGLLGDEFSYEDFLETTYFWAGQTALGKAKYGTRDCDLLRSTPGALDKTHYAEVKSWLDHVSGFPAHVEKTLKASANVKEFTYFGLRKTEGVWSATQVEVKIRGHSGSTLLIIDHGSPKAHLSLNDFSTAQLMHF